MCTDDELRAEVFRILELVVLAQNVIGLLDEDLLYLCM